ncbi:MAG: hypothetical protein RML49_08060, partial [Verrucomicrobiae bacterium]|nr:hypothetical protein [Verrucomicrobiae bacterium]
NPLLSPPSLSNALSAWFTIHSDLYMPFTLTIWSLTAALSYTLFGALHPAPFHLTTVLIHLISTLLVWHLLHTLLARLHHIKILNPPSQPPPTTATSLIPSPHLPPLLGAL